MIRILALLALLLPSLAWADTEITSLPFTTTTNGERYYLTGDLAYNGTGNAITVAHDAVTIDGDGFTVRNSANGDQVSLSIQGDNCTVQDLQTEARIRVFGVQASITGCNFSNTYDTEPTIRFESGGTSGTMVATRVSKSGDIGTGKEAIEFRAGATGWRIENCILSSGANSVLKINAGDLELVGNSIDGGSLSRPAVSVILSASESVAFHNNIVLGPAGSRSFDASNASWDGWTHSHNCYFGGGDLVRYEGTTYNAGTLSTIEATAISDDPLWSVDGQYDLGTNSPALNAGDQTYTVEAIDFDGDARVQGADVDMGCQEGVMDGGGETCTITLTETGGTQVINSGTGAGVYCLDGGADNVWTDEVQVNGPIAGTVIVQPHGGAFQDTLRPGVGDKAFLIQGTGTMNVTIRDFICQDDAGQAQYFVQNQVDNTKLLNNKTDSAVFFEAKELDSDGMQDTEVRGLVLDSPLTREIDSIFSYAGVADDQGPGMGETISVWIEDPIIRDVWYRGKTAGDKTPIKIQYTQGLQLDDMWIHHHVKYDNNQSLKLIAAQHGYADSVFIRNYIEPGYEGIGNHFAVVRGTNDEYVYRDSSLAMTFTNWDVRGGDYGIRNDAHFSRWESIKAFVGGRGGSSSISYAFGNSDEASADTLVQVLAVADSTVAMFYDHTPGPIWTRNCTFISGRIADYTTERGHRGVIHIKDLPEQKIHLYGCVVEHIDNDDEAWCITYQDGYDLSYLSIRDCAFSYGVQGGLMVEDGDFSNEDLTIAEMESRINSAGGSASGNRLAPQGTFVTANPATADSLGSYGLHSSSIAIDMADPDSALTTVDLDGNPRVSGDGLDGGTKEYVDEEQIGACCGPDGGCQLLTELDCATIGHSYQGSDTDCDPNPCPVPTGACCYDDGGGTCVDDVTEATCDGFGGTWFQDTTCSQRAGDANCASTGACCTTAGVCLTMTEFDCDDQGWSYQGDATTCSPDPCADPTGACCDGLTCTIETEADCTAGGDDYIGDGETCSPNPCLIAGTGACCVNDDPNCFVDTEANCDTAGGTWEGAATECNPNPCPDPTGVCCASDGSCTITTEAGCADTWFGGGTTCADNLCPTPVGACCLTGILESQCIVTRESQCDAFEGTYQGDGTDCDPDPCDGILLIAGRTRYESGASTWIGSVGPTLNNSADTLDYVWDVGADVRKAVIRFDLSEPIPGTVVDAWIDATIHNLVTGEQAISSIQVDFSPRPVVIAEATWNEYSDGNDWTTAGAGDVPRDRGLPEVAYIDMDPYSDGEEVRLASGLRARNLVRNWLMPNGHVSLVIAAESGMMAFKSGNSSIPPELTIIYLTNGGRRRAISILGR